MQHTLGRFRISVTGEADVPAKAAVPQKIQKLLSTPVESRSAEDTAQIAIFYQSIDPQNAADHARLEAIRSIVGMPTEIAQLEVALSADTPDLNTQREAWEKSILSGLAWLPLEITSAKSQAGATLTKQNDDSVLASGKDPMTDVYTVVGTTPIKNITAIRVEALPDPRLPANGPGRSPNGNFVLSGISVFAASKDAPEMSPAIEFKTAHATFEQDKYPAANALADIKDGGWAILPNAGKPAVATFYAREPFANQGNAEVTVILSHQFSLGHHALGKFRIWVTRKSQPDEAVTLPADILSIVKTGADKRNDQQKAKLNAFYRSVVPSLEPFRNRLAELKAETDAELKVVRGKKVSIPFLLNRSGFTGDVRVSLEGFVSGRDANTGAPTGLAGALKIEPLNLSAGKSAGRLSVEVERNSGFGPRYVVLRAESKIGEQTRVEFSPAFVLTVLEK